MNEIKSSVIEGIIKNIFNNLADFKWSDLREHEEVVFDVHGNLTSDDEDIFHSFMSGGCLASGYIILNGLCSYNYIVPGNYKILN